MCRSVQLKSSFYVLASGLLLPTVFKLFSLLTLAWNGNGQLDSFLKVRERSYSCKQESLYLYIYIYKKCIKTAYLWGFWLADNLRTISFYHCLCLDSQVLSFKSSKEHI